MLSQAEYPAVVATGAPFLLGLSYVGSLYVWRSPHGRDHPSTIKRRFVSAAGITLLSPLFVTQWAAPDLLAQYSLPAVLGLRTAGLLQAVLLPLLLTCILFLGPVCQLLVDGRALHYLSSRLWRQACTDWICWRNYVVAPFSEEFTFRACMLPVLLGWYTGLRAILVSPLFFGVAHFHHMVERIRKGQGVGASFLLSVFQFTYTTVFGMYSSYLFVRTGHFTAPFLVHAFCNFMGFPDFGDVVASEPRKRVFLCLMYLAGLLGFYFLLVPLTAPDLYSNTVYRDRL